MPSDLAALTRNEPSSPVGLTATKQVPPPRRRWATRVGLPAGILLTSAAVLAYSAGDTLWPARSVRVAPVVVKFDLAAQPAAGEMLAQAAGWVEADPFPIAVTALADGIVREMLVLEGAEVKAGQVVARLIDDDARIALSQRKAAFQQTQAELAAAEANLVEAERNWEFPVELERAVATAEANLAEKQAELERWPAELAREIAIGRHLAAQHRRVADLAANSQASDIERIEAEQADLAQQASVEAVQRRKPIIEAQMRMLEAELKAARENLRLRITDTRALADSRARVAQSHARLAAAEADLAEAALRLDRMEVVSPADGLVMNRLTEPGAKLLLNMDDPRSAQVVRLYDPRHLQVRVDVPLADAAKVGVGLDAEIVVDVLPDKVFRGRVTRIVHEADIQKNTLQIKIAIDDPSPEIKPEMLARARLYHAVSADVTTGSAAGGSSERLFVPASAVIERDGRAIVWLADSAERVAMERVVAVGRTRIEGCVQIESGLRPGDRVVLNPPDDLRNGTRIRIEEVIHGAD